jgi:hypothetical protein
MVMMMNDRVKTWLTATGNTEWYEQKIAAGDFNDLAIFLRGMGSGFRCYAWWKDGVMWCGTTGTKLSVALDLIQNEIDRLIELEEERTAPVPAKDPEPDGGEES